ncbi:hypothetical protein BCR42DRAFT_322582 [Absidia repens]|uniref:Uncharacterized protein n=1 Tax=Absidia repens TaxID=90262 RepID=A0A1X2IPX9_9FUNG|nr:hypothetical protein BCR42DRAFT_322582 [Absidia repens]
MAIYKLIQSHLFYDGLAIDVSEALTQGTVIMILVMALILAIPRRGIAFGFPKKPIDSIAYNVVWQFIKKYHAYMLSFGTVFNFHYHPANKYWTLFLELWVLIHGSITAYFQPGTGWQIFFYGFLMVFITNQVYDTALLRRWQSFTSWQTMLLYLLFIILVVVGFGMNDHRYYRILFIPVAEYLAVLYCLGLGLVGYGWIQRFPSHYIFAVPLMYCLAGAGVILSLAYILAGHLQVFNDY